LTPRFEALPAVTEAPGQGESLGPPRRKGRATNGPQKNASAWPAPRRRVGRLRQAARRNRRPAPAGEAARRDARRGPAFETASRPLWRCCRFSAPATHSRFSGAKWPASL